MPSSRRGIRTSVNAAPAYGLRSRKKVEPKDKTKERYPNMTKITGKDSLDSEIKEVAKNLPVLAADDELWDLDILKGTVRGKNKGVDSAYSVKQKVDYATAWHMTGSIPVAASMMKVPQDVAKRWHHQKWWNVVQDRIRRTRGEELDARMTNVIHGCMQELTDRLTEGDEVVLRDGTKTRKKVSAKDLAIITSIMYEKRSLGRGEATQRTEKVDTNKMLEQLKNQFKNVTKDIEGERVYDAPSERQEDSSGNDVEVDEAYDDA